MGYMIGVDVGGTFTDFSVFNQETGELFNYKDSSTPADPSRAIVKGVQDVLEIKQAGPETVSYLAHGTTVGTNALIEKKGCRLGLITTKRPELEDKAAVIARIHEAARYIPLDRLCLSPQCGFASCEIGNKLTEAQQWAKLALVKEIAEEVWG